MTHRLPRRRPFLTPTPMGTRLQHLRQLLRKGRTVSRQWPMGRWHPRQPASLRHTTTSCRNPSALGASGPTHFDAANYWVCCAILVPFEQRLASTSCYGRYRRLWRRRRSARTRRRRCSAPLRTFLKGRDLIFSIFLLSESGIILLWGKYSRLIFSIKNVLAPPAMPRPSSARRCTGRSRRCRMGRRTTPCWPGPR